MPRSPNDDYIREAIQAAQKVWMDWRNVFEHSGDINSNPILADSGRFSYFCNEWGVARTIRAGTSDEFRCTLRDSEDFLAALDDHTGAALDQLHDNVLRPRFGTRGGQKSVRSALSKIATFVRPAVFTAWDSYARPGLNLAVGRSKSAWFESYADYLSIFNGVWNGVYGERIRETINSLSIPLKADDLCFGRRVLDLYLMREGGYSHEADIADKRVCCQ